MDFEANNRKQGFFDISNIALILFINIILFSGVFLRFYQLEKVYSEVDDTILVAIHKAVFSDSIINKSIGPFELNITIKKELLNNLLDSPLYALFWGVRSSYPPGQFIFFPLIINESDSYYKKIFKGRLIPALFSSLSLFLFVLLLFNLNNNKLDHSFLIPTAVMAFSFNSVIYAHHMSPYSLTATTFLIAFILLNKALSNPDYTTRLFTYLAFLTIFNYLIVLTILPTSVALILSHKWYNWKKITNSLYKGFLSYILIFLPVALICLKLSHGIRGEVPPLFEEGLINYLFYFPLQFIKTASSVFASFTTNEIANMTLVSILILGGVIILFKKFSSLGSDKYVYLYVILFFIEWTILHLFKSLTMDQTRHVLMWLPGICLIIFLIIRHTKVNQFASMAISSFIIFAGIHTNLSIVNSKISRYDFEMIEKNKIDTVLTYGATIAPVLYFQGTKKVYNTEMWRFVNGFKELNLPDKMLLTSATISINEYLNSGQGWNNFMDLYDHYQIKPLKEDPSDIHFTFNNYTFWFNYESSGTTKRAYSMDGNSFFLYEMTRKVD